MDIRINKRAKSPSLSDFLSFKGERLSKTCHPEERNEHSILPVVDDSQDRQSDSEHTRLVNESDAGCFRMTLLRGAQTAALSLALSLFIAAPVMAADIAPVQTLDSIKSEQKIFLNSAHSNYILKELTADVTPPEGSITLDIGDKSYYYTPSENMDVLKTLASTGSSALIETTQDKALYTVGDKYYTYDTEKLKDSAYTLTEAASADEPNTITLYNKETVIKYFDPQTGKEVAEADRQEGVEYKEVSTIQTTPKYYTVSLKQTEYGDKIATGAVAHYYKWTKNGNKLKLKTTASAGEASISYWEDPSKNASRQITTNQNGLEINQNFIGLNTTNYGGAIYNDNGAIGNINSDFIDNYAFSSYNAAYSLYGGGNL